MTMDYCNFCLVVDEEKMRFHKKNPHSTNPSRFYSKQVVEDNPRGKRLAPVHLEKWSLNTSNNYKKMDYECRLCTGMCRSQKLGLSADEALAAVGSVQIWSL